MAGRDQRAHALDDVAVGDDASQRILRLARIDHRLQRHVDPDALSCMVLVREGADRGCDHEVAHEDAVGSGGGHGGAAIIAASARRCAIPCMCLPAGDRSPQWRRAAPLDGIVAETATEGGTVMDLSTLNISVADGAAFACFLVAWVGYAHVADRSRWGQGNLITTVHALRRRWMEEAMRRDNRIGDTNLLGNLMRSVTFLAWTTIFILGGLLAVLGAADRAREILQDLPLAASTTKVFWELKILVLLVTFTYGSSASPGRSASSTIAASFWVRHPRPTATRRNWRRRRRVPPASRTPGRRRLNSGLRAYYFGMAALCWFVHPALFVAATAWVVLVLYRREFRSRTRDVLRTSYAGERGQVTES